MSKTFIYQKNKNYEAELLHFCAINNLEDIEITTDEHFSGDLLDIRIFSIIKKNNNLVISCIDDLAQSFEQRFAIIEYLVRKKINLYSVLDQITFKTTDNHKFIPPSKLKEKKERKEKILPPEISAEIIQLYNAGFSCKKISEKLSLTPLSIRDELEKNGIKKSHERPTTKMMDIHHTEIHELSKTKTRVEIAKQFGWNISSLSTYINHCRKTKPGYAKKNKKNSKFIVKEN
jgi:hypothetical protein